MPRAASWSTTPRCSPRSTPATSAAARSTSAAPPTRCRRRRLPATRACIATPHIGGLTQPAIEHQAMETVAQLAALLKGELPAGAVNRGRRAALAKGHPDDGAA